MTGARAASGSDAGRVRHRVRKRCHACEHEESHGVPLLLTADEASDAEVSLTNRTPPLGVHFCPGGGVGSFVFVGVVHAESDSDAGPPP